MTKIEIITQINQMKKYINLSMLCKEYNKNNEFFKIDYNNLRNVLNGQNTTKLSEDKLCSFYDFIQNEFLANVLNLDRDNYLILRKDVFELCVNEFATKIKKESGKYG